MLRDGALIDTFVSHSMHIHDVLALTHLVDRRSAERRGADRVGAKALMDTITTDGGGQVRHDEDVTAGDYILKFQRSKDLQRLVSTTTRGTAGSERRH